MHVMAHCNTEFVNSHLAFVIKRHDYTVAQTKILWDKHLSILLSNILVVAHTGRDPPAKKEGAVNKSEAGWRLHLNKTHSQVSTSIVTHTQQHTHTHTHNTPLNTRAHTHTHTPHTHTHHTHTHTHTPHTRAHTHTRTHTHTHTYTHTHTHTHAGLSICSNSQCTQTELTWINTGCG